MKNNPEHTPPMTKKQPLFRRMILPVVIAWLFAFFIVSPDHDRGTAYSAGQEQEKSGRNTEEANGAGLSSREIDEINTFEPGAFENPDRCAGCHREIYEAWNKSKHRFAWEDPFYQPDYLKASRETGGETDVFCGECHAPIARRTGLLPPPDGSRFDETSKKGISCDYCHTVKEIVEPVNIKTISDPGRVKRGPRGDGRSPYHEVQHSEIHTDPAFCGACHNVVHPSSGAVVIDTYNDWKEGPYAREGIRCQDCHMTPGPGVEKNPGKSSAMGKERDHVATHFFPGGSVLFQERNENKQQAALAREMLEAAAVLETETTPDADGITLLVRIKNVGAGHKIPTGVAYIRKMWLEVTATDDSGEVVFTSGHIREDNRIDPEAVVYQTVFTDAQGNLTPKSWIAEEIAYDRRIPPKGYDEQTFDIPVAGNGEHRVTVRLLYRSMGQEAADALGIEGLEVSAVEMAKAELTLN
ncbi:MAG: multiheme c-type cytochrome [Desulfosalsimonadaceae bacterium]